MATTSLYERLGGYDAIAAVVDDLMQRLFSDPQVGVYWKGHSHDSKQRERQTLVNYLCHAAGGPVLYHGRDMKTSHEGLGISESDWQVTAGHLITTLETCNVPEPEKQELLAFISSLKNDIVECA